jgi:hypothetical protein
MNLMSSIASPAWVAGLKVVTSKCEYCHRSMALRNFSARKAGIKMGTGWYCSSACFSAGAERKFTELLKPSPERIARFSRMPLGLSLINRGMLTRKQFKEAVEVQKEAGGEIGELLVQNGSVTEEQVTSVLAALWGCPVFAVPKQISPSGVHIPATLIRLYSAIPLHYVAATKLLLVGFVHGIEYGLLYAIEQITGCKTQPCFVTPSDFQSQMQHMNLAEERLGAIVPKEVNIENAQDPAEMASILCGYGVDLEADEATIGKCMEFVWARLKSGPRDFDLLFRAG